MKKLQYLVLLLSFCGLTQCHQKAPKLHFLWIDGSANFARLNCPDSVRYYLDKIQAAGIDRIVVDLKPISGEVLYPSAIAPQIFEWKGAMRARDFNYPETILNEGKKRNLKIYAAINVFSEGWKQEERGPIYRDHPEWQTILYLPPDTLLPTTASPEGYAAFVNPADSVIQAYEISLMEEIINNYDFDGIILDRARYDNIASDFSDLSRQQFEKFIGKQVEPWPEAIYTYHQNQSGKWDIRPGKYYSQWLLYRAQVIHDFFELARRRVKKVNNDIAFATYTGAWYSSYYELGVNWASRTFNPRKIYPWANADYRLTGYAELLDFLFSGCYFYHVDMSEVSRSTLTKEMRTEPAMTVALSPENTVEGAARLAKKVTRGVTPVYGSLYVQQYYDQKNPEQFVKAIRKCLELTDGVMIFDLVHIENFGWWQYLAKALQTE